MALILIADDSETEIYVLKKILEKHNHQIITAEDGLQAIEVAQNENPDLIIMDVVMPNLNGFQATRRLSKAAETTHIPISCPLRVRLIDFLNQMMTNLKQITVYQKIGL